MKPRTLPDPGLISLTTADKIDQLIEAARAGAPWMVLVFERCRAQRLACLQVTRGYRIPRDRLEQRALPVLLILGDDDFHATGPAGWDRDELTTALRWSGSAFVFAGAGLSGAYDTAGAYAEATGRALIIETDATHLREWLDLLRATATKLAGIVLPEPGEGEARH